MYVALADVLNGAAADESVRVVLWHGAGDSFCAGNDVEDFLRNPPVADEAPQPRLMSDMEDFLGDPPVAHESPQRRLMNALVDFDKPLVAAVQGAAIGGGTTMLMHCDFVYAGESARFQMPFVDLAVVPEFGSSCSLPARVGHIRASELILLGRPFDARRALAMGLVTDVVPDERLLAIATQTARSLAAKWPGALQASKRLMKRAFRDQIKAAMKAENDEFTARIRSQEARQALAAFVEKHQPNHDRSAA